MRNRFIILAMIFGSCASKPDDHEKSKSEVIQTEKDFALMAKQKGIASAFVAFADSNAVIKRGDSLIKGISGIRMYYTLNSQKGELQWYPDFVDVSGDLGYTFGKYNFKTKLPNGEIGHSSGYFHTVWKRQRDGSWKFVWD
jgi:ketosteroid isomerase-like protein